MGVVSLVGGLRSAVELKIKNECRNSFFSSMVLLFSSIIPSLRLLAWQSESPGVSLTEPISLASLWNIANYSSQSSIACCSSTGNRTVSSQTSPQR